MNLYILGSVAVVSLISFVGLYSISIRESSFRRSVSLLVPLAIGALLGDAFFHLIPEAFEEVEVAWPISLAILLGMLAFLLLEKYLRWHHHSDDAGRSDVHVGPLVLISDGLHNFVDGVLIAVSYFAGLEVGLATTLAVILHEIPQELGDFGVLIHAGYERSKALFYNFLSALTAVLGALIVITIGELPENLLKYIIPFGAGMFIYIAASDLIPDLQRKEKGGLFREIIVIGIGITSMFLLLFLE
jgi:zinc and cadmium transporter